MLWVSPMHLFVHSTNSWINKSNAKTQRWRRIRVIITRQWQQNGAVDWLGNRPIDRGYGEILSCIKPNNQAPMITRCVCSTHITLLQMPNMFHPDCLPLCARRVNRFWLLIAGEVHTCPFVYLSTLSSLQLSSAFFLYCCLWHWITFPS